MKNTEGYSTEKHRTSPGRKVRNCIDLLSFALENDDTDKIQIYKAKLFTFGITWPLPIVELFERFQFVAEGRYYTLMFEILKKVDKTAGPDKLRFYVKRGPVEDALESVPIYLVCMGAQIQRNEPELFNQFLDIGWVFNLCLLKVNF